MLARILSLTLALTLAACAGREQPPASEPAAAVDARATWEQLSALLPGRWIATTEEGVEIDITFRSISNGSALVESFNAAAGHETVTVYHPDGAALLLTHYCGQGNQATLRATAVDGQRIVFSFASVTNAEPEQGVMSELVYELDPAGARALTRIEGYRLPDGSIERTTLRLRALP